ncbi:TetR/AcrR family transcriptional regulator [Rhodococcus qingshengii]|uniref:TetR/AcrR family transcriptional regulator n=1 Tax=Rhodococcus qingshengii TaxID=334542 RepID=UPI0024BB8D83|nr:TetR/AcrR family transcriptional regulator [Rhodococcus qingshengii]MDJ0441206.1 TetR/AcrR family transcriptional regulator [Rhodococcus qingshengii]
MSENTVGRRPSYGSASPEVGRRGANTRRKIIDCSLELFGDLGFFETSVEAIANSVGVSRATLYQYFPGKHAIFHELMTECGVELLDVSQRIGPLGPTENGFLNLNRWVSEWSWVFDKYSAMFVQWSIVAGTEDRYPSSTNFTDNYQYAIAQRLRSANFTTVEAQTGALAAVAIVHRLNMYLHTARAYGKSIHSLVDITTIHLQLMLFPQTPATVLARRHARSTRSTVLEVPSMPETMGFSVSERAAKLRPRGVKTLLTLVETASYLFARDGFNRTSIDDIVAEAGVSRGTFYTYFSDKQDLLLTVSVEAGLRVIALTEHLGHLESGHVDEAALREWLTNFVSYEAQFTASIDTWTGRTTDHQLVIDLGHHAQARADSAILTMLHGRSAPGAAADPIGSALVFRAVLERIPRVAQESVPPLSHDSVIDLLTTLIMRGFFSSRIG